MPGQAADLARRLAREAEAVCRHYLSNGRSAGCYWVVGDVANTPGRSLYVRLKGPASGKGAAGKWTDAATGQHGDLLDLIALNRGLGSLGDVLDEARLFLALPRPQRRIETPARQGSPEAARRLFAMSQPVTSTLAEAYLRERGITDLRNCGCLRFHPRCFYRPEKVEPQAREAWPALIAAVTDVSGRLTGVQRTWLDPSGRAKAPVFSPRRAMGHLLGNAVRFSPARPAAAQAGVMAVGEGIETMLSLRQVLPAMPIVAALSANHLAALVLPPGLCRLYFARDRDPAGNRGVEALATRAEAAGIEALTLDPMFGDFNDDLRTLGPGALLGALRPQLAPKDVARFVRQEHAARQAG